MKQVTVISGKGGTGKTSFVAAFANLSGASVVADCDVDAANLHLILGPVAQRAEPEAFKSGYGAVLDPDRCRGCGQCARACRFGALRIDERGKAGLNPLLCEGCGVCVDVCPRNALTLVEKTAGELFVSETRFGPLVHGRLGIGQSASGKLVAQVRARARELAGDEGRQLILVDGSPGLGCPVIASLSGVDAAVIVSEPTVAGLHDLERVLRLCSHFGVKPFVVVNKWDLNPEMAERLEKVGRSHGAEVLGRVGFTRVFTEAMIHGRTVVEYAPESAVASELRAVWQKLAEAVQV
ncbi:MAG: 4Fe-4S binding protein [Bacillota bacterium]|nr:4Fe-4S binding protein [Bacillota bacterium]